MRFLLFIFIQVFNCLVVFSQPTQTTAIVHSTVVNVISGMLDIDQTVLIDSNRVSNIGPFKKIKIPEGALIINGTGKFLMPGMIDGHIHFFQSGGLYTRPDGLNLSSVYSYEKDQRWIKDNLNGLLARYLACGITTVIDVGGPFSNYDVRGKVTGEPKAPDAWVTGPLISTYLPPNLDKKDPPIIKVNSEEEARELVKKQLPFKPDFIKIWYIVLNGQKAETNLPIVKAAIEESHAHGLKVAVHATEYETARLAILNGADILVHSIDDKVLDDEMLQLLRSKQTVYIPTLIVAQNYNRTFTQQFNFSSYDLAHADPFMVGSLMDIQHIEKNKLPFDYKQLRTRLPVPGREDSIMLANLKLVQQKGGLVVAGTDAGNIGTQHASSYFDELLVMKQAGLSNWEIIRSATINAARGFGKEKESGSIEKGKRADMLLLDKDPTQDLSALASINTVIHRGRPFKPAELLPVTPEFLVQQQLNAYNLRNIDAFLEPYADSVEIYFFPDRLIGKGKATMRNNYEMMFSQFKDLHCEVTKRMLQGNTVIDHEAVTGMGPHLLKAVAIYKIENNRIAKVYFIQ